MKIPKIQISNLIFTVLIAAGIFFRFFQLGVIPQSLYWDELAIGYDAFVVSKTGEDMHQNQAFQAMFPSYGDYKLPVYILIDAIAVKIFGLSAFSTRLPSAIAGTILIFICYLITKELISDKKVWMLSAIFMAWLPADILFSRTGFEGHLAVLFVGLTVYLWLAARRNTAFFIGAGFTAAVAVYCYFSTRIVIPLMGISTLIAMHAITTKKWKAGLIASIVLTLLLLIPLINSPYYESSNQFRLSTKNLAQIDQFAIESNVLREQSGNSLLSRFIYHRRILQLKAIMGQMLTHIEPDFLFFKGDSNLRHSTGEVGVMFSSSLVIFVIGWLVLISKHKTLAVLFSGLWLASILPAAIPTEVPHTLRSLNSILIFPIILAVGLNSLLNKNKYLGLILGIILSLQSGLFLHDYFAHYPKRSAMAWQSGYESLVNYLKDNYQNYDQVTIDFPDDRLYLSFLFYNGQLIQQSDKVKKSYQLNEFDKFQFKPVNKLSFSLRNWYVLSPAKWQELKRPEAEVIYSNANEPQFYVAKGF